MAEKYKNAREHLIIKMSIKEAKEKCHFGFAPFLVCDNCNEEINDTENVYYFASLNRLFCSDCAKYWSNQPRYYDSHSIDYEKYNYNYYANLLGLEKIN